MGLGMRKNPCSVRNPAGFRIIGPVVEARDPRRSNRTSAHRARLQRHIKIMPRQTS